MVKLLEVRTENVNAIKTLFEVLKDVLEDVNIEFRRDDEMNLKAIAEAKEAKSSSSKYSELSDDEEYEKSDKKKDKTETREGGIKIMATDEKRTLLIDVKLNASNFDTFWCKHKTIDIGINVGKLHTILKSLDKDDILTIGHDSDDKLNLQLKVLNTKKNYDSLLRLKLQDINKHAFKIPPTEFDATITIDTAEFHRVCREMSVLAHYLEIKCTKKAITFTCKGDCIERSSTYYNIEALKKDEDDGEDPRGVNIMFGKKSKTEIVQGIFKLDYLVMFTKCASLCSEIQIYMRNNYPLCIRYTVATLGRILFCLSPYNAKNIDRNFDDDDEFYDSKEVNLKV